jgi:hypothetical protein
VPVPFIIDVTSLTLANAAGQAAGFAPDANCSWTIDSARDGINGFDAGKFVIDSSGFANDPDSTAFSLTQAGNDLVLNDTAAVPEALVCGLVGLAMLGGVIRRRR